MHYEKPRIAVLADAVIGIQSPSHTKGINVQADSNLSDTRPTSGAYEADE
jgi:hypothetical protein